MIVRLSPSLPSPSREEGQGEVEKISPPPRRRRVGKGVRFAPVLLASILLFALSLFSPAYADWKADWDATIAAAKKEGALVLSVPSGRAWRDALAKFQEAYPDIKTEMTPVASRDFWPR